MLFENYKIVLLFYLTAFNKYYAPFCNTFKFWLFYFTLQLILSICSCSVLQFLPFSFQHHFWEAHFSFTTLPAKILDIFDFTQPSLKIIWPKHKHKMNAITKITNTFSFWKRKARESPKSSMPNCYYFNQAWMWPGPEHYLCYKALGQTHADLST